MVIYDKTENKHINMPKEMNDFLKDIQEVCIKHGLSISHKDVLGDFEIEEYSLDNINWLFAATKSYKEPNKLHVYSDCEIEGHCIGPETRTPNSIFTDNEMIKIWLSDLLNKSNKCFTIYLTIDEINSEIKEVECGISNEKIWAHTDPVHENNISTLSKYLDILNEILEERKTFEQNKLNGGNEEC
jgi:cob(I)alamin adenosyltransferase